MQIQCLSTVQLKCMYTEYGNQVSAHHIVLAQNAEWINDILMNGERQWRAIVCWHLQCYLILNYASYSHMRRINGQKLCCGKMVIEFSRSLHSDNAINWLSGWYAYGVIIGYIRPIWLNVRCYPISAVWYIPSEACSLTSSNHFELRLDAITLKQPVNRLQSICKLCKNIGDTMKILTKRITMASEWTIKMRFCCHVTFGPVLHLQDKWR